MLSKFDLWHKRVAHCNVEVTQKMKKESVGGVYDFSEKMKEKPCESYL